MIAKHKTAFKHPLYRENTELSKTSLGTERIYADFILNWKTIKRARLYSNANGQNCDLCMIKKTFNFKVKVENSI